MIVKDWMQDAADAIEVLQDRPEAFDAMAVIDILAAHCPFKPDTAYIPVSTSEAYSQDLVNALNAGEWEKATQLLVTKVDALYRR